MQKKKSFRDKLIQDVNSVGGMATRYRLDDPGIESWRGRNFPHLSRPGLVPTQPPAKWLLDLFTGRKAAGEWR